MPIGAMITAAAIDAAKELASGAVNRWLSSKNKKEQDLVSIGLAVGYFYNFLDPINKILETNVLDLYMPGDQKKASLQNPKKSFDLDNVYVEIIIPKRLDPEARRACNDEFKRYDKGFFYMQEHKRFYGVNYFTASIGGTERLTIVDIARPAFAAQRFYEDVLGQRSFNNDEKWYLTQISELTAFKETLLNLRKLGNGVLVNRMSFKDIG